MRIHSRLFALIVVLSGLAACATQPPVPESREAARWQQHRAKISASKHWVFKGRIAIRLEKDGFSASLHWRQAYEDYTLRVIAPLGRGTFELQRKEGAITLKTADNKLFHAKDAESLMQNHLGWHVPVAGLGYWLRGLPQPDVLLESLTLDAQGRVRELRQSGWWVRYKSYLDKDNYALPGQILLQNSALKLRFSIRQWEIY